jgi:subtilase family serine protease
MLGFDHPPHPVRAGISVLSAGALAFVALITPAAAAPNPPTPPQPTLPSLPDVVPACAGVPAQGFARCHALIRARAGAHPSASSAFAGGYTPSNLESAYGLMSAANTIGAGRTVAIVDAYHNPTAAQDLAAYRAFFNLPTCASGACFRQVDQTGGTNYPSVNAGWASEIALDIEMVSAICPQCNILLVEANSASYGDLGAAVNYAASQGVVAISNSYGGSESIWETSYESAYNHPGIAVTVSSGDGGYGVEFPAASRYVTAVGGTSLNLTATGTRANETVWTGAGSGCSRYIPKPSWQKDSGCNNRTVADVAAVADPYTGVAVLDTTGSGGWTIFGGTSVASPIIAAVYALAGNTGSTNYGSYPYGHAASLFDVTSGSDGNCKRSALYLCTGVKGYDGPTGVGTPNGTSAF